MADGIWISGLGTAQPPHRVERDLLERKLRSWMGSISPAAQSAFAALPATGVDTRSTCFPDFSDASGGLPFGAKPIGSKARFAAFAEHAPPLAARAAQRAIESAAQGADAITHLISVSTTGFVSPAVEVGVARALGLRHSVERLAVGFLGCEGFQAGLRAARRIAEADARARVLVVYVELPSLHFRLEDGFVNIVASALFGDGAGALIVQRATEGLARLGPAAQWTTREPDASAGFAVGDDGLVFFLPSGDVDGTWAAVAPTLRDCFGAGAYGGDGFVWCVHPADRVTLDQVERRLGLAPTALAASRAALSACGNVIAAGSVFALERALATSAPGSHGVLLGVRAGLSVLAQRFEMGTPLRGVLR